MVAVPTLAVSAIYCIWHTYQLKMVKRVLLLRQRLAYMLWVMATGVEHD